MILEFLSPFEFKPIRLRLYDFTDAKTGVVKNKVAPGHERSIRIPTSAFNNESSEFLKNSLPSLSVARVSAELSKDRQILLESNLVSFDVERGLQSLSKDRPTVKGRVHTGKPPKLGIEGCCGLGCNGCLMFWNDPKYTKARENMKSRLIGEKLWVFVPKKTESLYRMSVKYQKISIQNHSTCNLVYITVLLNPSILLTNQLFH